MRFSKLPPETLLKLMALDEQGAGLARAADEAEARLQQARNLLNNVATDPRVDLKALREGFDDIHRDALDSRRRADAFQRMLSQLKAWLDRLGDDTVLQVAPVQLNGQNLGGVRNRLDAVEAEIGAIEMAPMPPADLRERMAAYVASLAYAGRPEIAGILPGCTPTVVWPLHVRANRAKPNDRNDFDPSNANALLMAAFLFPERLAANLIEMVERLANNVVPVVGRAEKLAALRVEREDLLRLEAALIDREIEAGADEVHSLRLPPEAVLGVRLANGG